MSKGIAPGPVKYYAEIQYKWERLVPKLRRDRYTVNDPSSLSIHGDAPKVFLRIQEYVENGKPISKPKNWTGYIAKVGIKHYPIESITEHLLTRMGQCYELRMAESKLLIMSEQVRFLSKYFLNSTSQSLVHGYEIFGRYLADDMFVKQIADSREERHFYTFQTVCAALKGVYPEACQELIPNMARMLAFDCLVGNQDRHPLNWGVIAPIAATSKVTYSPIFDTARGLFWNTFESQLGDYLANPQRMRAYVHKCSPLIGWDSAEKLNHFDLLRNIYRDYPDLRSSLSFFGDPKLVDRCCNVVEDEFKEFYSKQRRQAIRACLKLRHEAFVQALSDAMR